MKKMTITFVMTVLFALAFSLQAQTVYYVDPAGTGGDGLSWVTAFKTVKAAIDKVTTTEETIIYLKEDANFPESNLNTGLAGGNQAMAVNITIIGKNTTLGAGGSTYRILRSQAENLTLKGITFQNVNGYTSIGGVIYFAGTNLTIDSCVFKNNKSASTDGGAAIGIAGSSVSAVTIRNSLFQSNAAEGLNSTVTKGGVITYQATAGNLVVENCTFQENTQSSTYGASVIGFNGGTNVTATFTNNTFFNNSTKNKDASSIPNIYITGTVTASVVNNTFYFDKRDALTPEQEETITGDSEKQTVIYKHNNAVRIDAGTLHFINNVVSGTRNAVSAGAATGRTITVKNNYAVVLEPHTYVPELAISEKTDDVYSADANGNILITARTTNTGNPPAAHIAALDALLPIAGLATTLNEDVFPAYLPFTDVEEGDSNPLIDTGLDTYIVNEVEYIPQTDVLGTTRGLFPDLGAFEYLVHVPSGESATVSEHATLGGIVFYSDDAGTGQLTGPATVTPSGVVKLVKTFKTNQWYPVGFPFEIDNEKITIKYVSEEESVEVPGVIYDGNQGSHEFTEPGGNGSSGCNFFVKGYNATSNHFEFTDAIAANTGYTVEFPAGEFGDATEVEVTFVSTESPALTIGETGAAIPDGNASLSLVVNSNVSNITGFAGAEDYYQYNYDPANPQFIRKNSGTLTEALMPFEAIVAVKTDTPSGEYRSAIGDGSSGAITALESFPDLEEPQEVQYYTLQGVRIYSPQADGVYIAKKVYASGKTDVSKVIYKK
jgi:hypothetical protein